MCEAESNVSIEPKIDEDLSSSPEFCEESAAEDEEQPKEGNRSITLLRNEKRILYYKKNNPLKIIGDPSRLINYSKLLQSQNVQNKEISDVLTDAVDSICANENDSDSTETPLVAACDRNAALDRLKTMTFSAPPVNIISESCSTAKPPKAVLTNANAVPIGSKTTAPPPLRLFSGPVPKKAVPKKRRRSPPVPKFSSGDMVDLEPGEVPDPDYVPPSLGNTVRLVYIRVYPCDPWLMNVPFNAFNYEHSSPNDFEDDEVAQFGAATSSWKPDFDKNLIQELLKAAKEKLTKEPPDQKTQKAFPDGTIQSVFPQFPSSCESDFKKLKKQEKKKIGRQYKVKFTNDVSMLRHHKNRWIKGGRLSTTGKFIEGDSENDDDAEEGDKNGDGADPEGKTASGGGPDITEEMKILNTLEKEEREMQTQKYDTHFVYEDTHQYAEYLKWYAEVHGEPRPGGFSSGTDAAETQKQRQWFQFYRGAVKFADIPEDDDDNDLYKTSDETDDSPSALNVKGKLELYYQQWRWKQVRQWNQQMNCESVRVNPNGVDAGTSRTDGGVSYSGQPVAYPTTSRDNDNGAISGENGVAKDFENGASGLSNDAAQAEYYEQYCEWWKNQMLRYSECNGQPAESYGAINDTWSTGISCSGEPVSYRP